MTAEFWDFVISSNTGISTWPSSLISNIRLKRLLASGNNIAAIPSDAFLPYAASLEYLDISYNQLRAFPEAVNELRVLTTLDMSFNMLGTVPLGMFTNCRHRLTTLYLVHDFFREIPPGLRDLSALQNLYIGYNPIASAANDVFSGRIGDSLQVGEIFFF